MAVRFSALRSGRALYHEETQSQSRVHIAAGRLGKMKNQMTSIPEEVIGLFSIDLNLSATVWPWGLLSLEQK
jgi:hypothetical protein